MIVLMPLLAGQNIHPSVIIGIRSQTAQCDLKPHWQDAHNRKANRELNINFNRATIQKSLNTNEKYVLLLDSDVVMTDTSTVDGMCLCLESNPEIGCVAVPSKSNYHDAHVCCALAMIRTEIYHKIDFLTDPKKCQCLKIMDLCKSVYLLGYTAYEIDRVT